MKTLFASAAVALGLAFAPATASADNRHHGHHGHHHNGHRHGGWGHGGWGHHHHHHHHGHWGHYRPAPVYRIQPYPYPYYGYRGGVSIGTPNVWIQSGW